MTSLAPQILDPCCGGRMFWFNKHDPRATFCDIRAEKHTLCDGRVFEVRPDTVADFRNLPFPDASFNLIVFDPPHLVRAGEKSWMRKKYGSLDSVTWQATLSQGFSECWRVLKSGGTLIFKWNETQIKLREVLSCFPQSPVFGHTTTTNLKTHWITFYKQETPCLQATLYAQCPYCGHVSATMEEAIEHGGICPKHPAVMRAMKAEADKAALEDALAKIVSHGGYSCEY